MARRRNTTQMLLVPLLDVDALWREIVEMRGWTAENINADAQHLTAELAQLTEDLAKLDRKREKIIAQVEKLTATRDYMNSRLVGGRQYLEAFLKQVGGMGSRELAIFEMNQKYPPIRRGRGRPRGSGTKLDVSSKPTAPKPTPAAQPTAPETVPRVLWKAPEPKPTAPKPTAPKTESAEALDMRLVHHLDEEGKSDRDLAKELKVSVSALRAIVKRVQVSNPDVIRTSDKLVALRPHAPG